MLSKWLFLVALVLISTAVGAAAGPPADQGEDAQTKRLAFTDQNGSAAKTQLTEWLNVLAYVALIGFGIAVGSVLWPAIKW
jgi:hypothetical protein